MINIGITDIELKELPHIVETISLSETSTIEDVIHFDPIEHKYTNSRGEEYLSVTRFLSLFHEHFSDVEDFWLLYKAIQYCSDIDKEVKIKKYNKDLDLKINSRILSKSDYSNYISYAIQYCNKSYDCLASYLGKALVDLLNPAVVLIKESWVIKNKEANEKGTLIHNLEEERLYSDGFYEYKGIKYPVHSSAEVDLRNLKVGVYPELRLHNHKYKLSGTSDVVLVLPGRRIKIIDYKSNESLIFVNSYNTKMLAPISHLSDCNGVHYNIQLSIYGWMLKQFGYSVEPTVDIIYINSTYINKQLKKDDPITYEMKFLEKEVEEMLEYYVITKT